ALDLVAGGLGLIGDDRHLLTDHPVEERRFADVGPADDRAKARAELPSSASVRRLLRLVGQRFLPPFERACGPKASGNSSPAVFSSISPFTLAMITRIASPNSSSACRQAPQGAQGPGVAATIAMATKRRSPLEMAFP